MVHNVRTTYELSSSGSRRLYKFQFTPAILNFHIWFIYFLSAYVIFTITHAKFNEPSRWCGKSWHCKLPRKTCISPDLALPLSIFTDHVLWLPCSRTESNLIEHNRTWSMFDCSIFLWELDWVRLPNPSEPNHTTEFDWVWLNSINQMFNLVWLVTLGKHKDLKPWNKMCKHDNLKQRKYKLIPVLIL